MPLARPLLVRTLGVLACSIALAGPAFALKGVDAANGCEVDIRGNWKLEGINTTLKEGTKVSVYDGCEKKTVTLEVREVNRWETLDGVRYTLDTLDRSRMDGLRTRRFDLKAQ